MLNAKQFVNHVNKTGGATMSVNSGKMVQPGKKGYMVGGEPDTEGNRIPTRSVPEAEFGEGHVYDAVKALHELTGGRPGVHLGAWKDNGNVELDASRMTKKPGEAIRKGRARGEKAIWDNKKMTEIDTGGRG